MNNSILNKYGKKVVTTALLLSTISVLGLSTVHAENTIEVDSKPSLVEAMMENGKVIKKNNIVYAIEIDDKEIVYLESEEKAKEVLEKYKDIFTREIEDIGEIKSIEILEDINLVQRRFSDQEMESIDDLPSAISKIKSGGLGEKKHIIKDNDNFWSLSQSYGITIKDIENANPGKDTRFLKHGDEIMISSVKPLLTVSSYEEKKVEEEIDFETKYEIDEELYENEEEIRVNGIKGKTQKEIGINRHNGVEVSQEIIKEEVVAQPVKQVIIKGTKPALLGVATGSFSTPAKGRISSTYGHRWGRLHAGLDIAAGVGEPINAADGGTVTYAQYNNGGYGYMVDIDHGNGYVTRYAHSSKLYVNPGDKVNKGDLIASVGSTGKSTGPHLHFEVRKDGVPQDPQGYLDKN